MTRLELLYIQHTGTQLLVARDFLFVCTTARRLGEDKTCMVASTYKEAAKPRHMCGLHRGYVQVKIPGNFLSVETRPVALRLLHGPDLL